jgi:hypothetical protein
MCRGGRRGSTCGPDLADEILRLARPSLFRARRLRMRRITVCVLLLLSGCAAHVPTLPKPDFLIEDSKTFFAKPPNGTPTADPLEDL